MSEDILHRSRVDTEIYENALILIEDLFDHCQKSTFGFESTIRSKKNVCLAIASSGFAVTLLDGDRTAHSTLKLPLNMHETETLTCNITKKSGIS